MEINLLFSQFAQIKTREDKEMLINEIKQVPEPLLDEVLDFVQFLKIKTTKEKGATAITGKSSLKEVFAEMIEKIGISSVGGSSVEDVRMERQR